MSVPHSQRQEYRKEYIKKHYAANKQYYIEKAAARRQKMKLFIDELKDKPCTDCGIKYPPYVMEFDHLGDKKFNLASAARQSYSIKKILEEVAKCELVCSNCHRERTHSRYADVV